MGYSAPHIASPPISLFDGGVAARQYISVQTVTRADVFVQDAGAAFARLFAGKQFGRIGNAQLAVPVHAVQLGL